MTEEQIPIRSIQHWLYCRHRWGLLEIDCAWAENYYVTKANLLHRRVHDDNRYVSKAKGSHTGVTVFNDMPQYGLVGVTDCLEESHGQYTIVEYKPTQPKSGSYRHEDLMQVFSQKICVDHVFHCNSMGVIYYADTRKRVKLPLQENYDDYDAELKQILQEMRKYLREGIIPPIEKGQKCSGCSMKDLCMPSRRKRNSLKKSIAQLLEEKL